MKTKSLLIATVLVAASGAALAQAKPDYELGFNVGLTTDYRYRGISQSRLQPAVSGGVDFSHKGGFYLGAWASSIKWIKDAGGSGNIEVDVYGGYKFDVGPVGLDVGALLYIYPDNKLSPNADTQEIYIGASFGPATLKYSHALSNLFGAPNSKGSHYLDLSASFDLGGGWSITPHIGYQKIKNFSPSGYTDYSLTVGKDLGNGLSASAAIIGIDRKNLAVSPSGKDLGRTQLVVGVKYEF